MIQVVIWLIAFTAILVLSFKRWESVSPALDKALPEAMKSRGDNAAVWSLALAILGATTLVRPVEILLTVILIGLVGLIGAKVAGWASSKVDHH